MNEPLLLDRQLCFALYAASRAMTQAYQPLLGPLGLTYPQYLVMLVLWEQDGLTVKQLGERLALDSGTLTPLLKRLESAGRIRRQRLAEDERQVGVWLTEAGLTLKSDAATIPATLQCRYGGEAEQLGALRDTLHALRHTLQSS